MPRHHVFAAKDLQEGRQAASLLQRRREPARRRRTGRSEARSSPRRDQRLSGTGVAPVDRGVRRSGRPAEDFGAVSRRSLRGDFAGRLDRSAEAVAIAAVSAAAMGRLLAGAFVLGGVAARSVLVGAPAGEPQRHALGSGAFRAGRLSPAGAGQRMAVASGVVRTDGARRLAGRRFRAGRDPQALSLSRSVVGAQRGAVRSSDGAAGATCSTRASICCSTI